MKLKIKDKILNEIDSLENFDREKKNLLINLAKIKT